MANLLEKGGFLVGGGEYFMAERVVKNRSQLERHTRYTRDFKQFERVETMISCLSDEQQKVFGEIFVGFLNHGGLTINEAERLAFSAVTAGNANILGAVKSERF